MATVSFSTAHIRDVMTNLTTTTGPSDQFGNLVREGGVDATANINTFVFNLVPFGSLFSRYNLTGANNSNVIGGNPSNQVRNVTGASGSVSFRNSSGTTLTSYLASELTRTIDAEGYAVLANFPPKLPTVAGTISDIHFMTVTGRTMTLTVGAPNSAADVQFDDRALVTSQPWRLDGSIKFRVPMSYEFTT
jgi:hypothetical protein